MPTEPKTIPIPNSYVNPPGSHVRISNYPEAAPDVTPIQIVKLNRPEKLNAITGAMIQTLIDFFTTVSVDDRVKVVIFTGAGKAFSAGIDLTGDVSQEKNRIPSTQMRDPGGTLALAMFNCTKPIIVAYNGLAVGIGMTSTLAAAIRYLTSSFIRL
jgi:enoyl-CoA hydratase/carnithine racemase